MQDRIIYMGDDFIGGAATYLAGIMTHYELPFDYQPSAERPDDSFTEKQYGLYILSDYPAQQFKPGQLDHIAQSVQAGSGLLMIGGWESFYGRLGEYHQSPLVNVLPIKMADADDRHNYAQPCLIEQQCEHPILNGMPWQTPPGIGGFNAFEPKPDAQTLLCTTRFKVQRDATANDADQYDFKQVEKHPLLVVGRHGEGRVAALATDVAPHWVGGFVDWGDSRVVQEVEDEFIDVGGWYAQFFRNLLQWTRQWK